MRAAAQAAAGLPGPGLSGLDHGQSGPGQGSSGAGSTSGHGLSDPSSRVGGTRGGGGARGGSVNGRPLEASKSGRGGFFLPGVSARSEPAPGRVIQKIALARQGPLGYSLVDRRRLLAVTRRAVKNHMKRGRSFTRQTATAQERAIKELYSAEPPLQRCIASWGACSLLVRALGSTTGQDDKNDGAAGVDGTDVEMRVEATAGLIDSPSGRGCGGDCGSCRRVRSGALDAASTRRRGGTGVDGPHHAGASDGDRAATGYECQLGFLSSLV